MSARELVGPQMSYQDIPSTLQTNPGMIREGTDTSEHQEPSAPRPARHRGVLPEDGGILSSSCIGQPALAQLPVAAPHPNTDCPQHATQPKANAEWWRTKLDKNMARDVETTEHLRAEGWTVLRFWEHEAPGEVADAVRETILWLRLGIESGRSPADH
jgi:Protein of unknown function (DUF559)